MVLLIFNDKDDWSSNPLITSFCCLSSNFISAIMACSFSVQRFQSANLSSKFDNLPLYNEISVSKILLVFLRVQTIFLLFYNYLVGSSMEVQGDSEIRETKEEVDSCSSYQKIGYFKESNANCCFVLCCHPALISLGKALASQVLSYVLPSIQILKRMVQSYWLAFRTLAASVSIYVDERRNAQPALRLSQLSSWMQSYPQQRLAIFCMCANLYDLLLLLVIALQILYLLRTIFTISMAIVKINKDVIKQKYNFRRNKISLFYYVFQDQI